MLGRVKSAATRARGFWRPANLSSIARLRGLHDGAQCVILATGPSLGDVDLALLDRHPFVCGTNGAFLTRKRFAYYFCSSPNFFCPNEARIAEVEAERFIYSCLIPYRPSTRNVYLRLDRGALARKEPMTRFRDNLFGTLSWGPTVLLDVAIPAALWMGFSEIVLLGADYPLGRYTHFYDEAEEGSPRPTVQIDFNEEMKLAHHGYDKLVEHLARRRPGVKIYNCSPRSELPHFEKPPLADVVRLPGVTQARP